MFIQVSPRRVRDYLWGAKGADTFGRDYGEQYGYTIVSFPADWNKHGRAAGPIRNGEMAKYASEGTLGILLAFWDGESKGTKNMMKQAKGKGLRVFVSRYT